MPKNSPNIHDDLESYLQSPSLQKTQGKDLAVAKIANYFAIISKTKIADYFMTLFKIEAKPVARKSFFRTNTLHYASSHHHQPDSSYTYYTTRN